MYSRLAGFSSGAPRDASVLLLLRRAEARDELLPQRRVGPRPLDDRVVFIHGEALVRYRLDKRLIRFAGYPCLVGGRRCGKLIGIGLLDYVHLPYRFRRRVQLMVGGALWRRLAFRGRLYLGACLHLFRWLRLRDCHQRQK
jgi:hypothetical protein